MNRKCAILNKDFSEDKDIIFIIDIIVNRLT